MEHGAAKLLKGPDVFAGILQVLGACASSHGVAHHLDRATRRVAVFLGAFVTLVSLPMAVVLLVAIFTVHLPYGFSSIKLVAVTPAGARFGPVGYETNLLYLAALVCLLLGGSGPLAIDGLLHKRTQHAGGSIPHAVPSERVL